MFIIIYMNEKLPVPLLPKEMRILEKMGAQIAVARLRRNMPLTEMSMRTGLSRVTLYKIENGDPSVAIGSYMKVLWILRLQEDFLKIAKNDEYGRDLMDYEAAKRRTKK